MKKLYVVAQDGESEFDEIYTIIAKNENELEDRLTEKAYKSTFDLYAEFTSLDGFLDDVKNIEIDIFKNLIMGNMEGFEKDVFRHKLIQDYIVKDYEIKPDTNTYVVLEHDFEEWQDEVKVVNADTLEEAMDKVRHKVALEQMGQPFFREHVEERAINFGLCEDFWELDGKYVWNMHVDADRRFDDHVYAEYRCMSDNEIEAKLQEVFKDNVRSFFDTPKFAKQYIDYYFSNDEPNFSDDFYYEVSKNLCRKSDWTGFHVRGFKH